MAFISKTIGSAMTTQLERVNNSDERLREKNRRLLESNEILRNRLRELQEEVARLSLQLDDTQSKLEYTAPNAPRLHHGRPVIDARTASKRSGIALHTVYRYLREGHWQADTVGGQYVIFADQPLTKKTPKKRGPKPK